MGWDVVQIGLNHNLPVSDPYATAKEIAQRMHRNIRLVYSKEYEYDVARNAVAETGDYEVVELGTFKVDNSDDFLQMSVVDYQAHQILQEVGYDKLSKANFATELAECILDTKDEFALYEIENIDKPFIFIRIFRENVDLYISVIERWMRWEQAFHNIDANREWLQNYRMQIYERAKMFGCKEVIICSDQGPTEDLFAKVYIPAAQLKKYACSFQYVEDSLWFNNSQDKEDWRRHAKHINFADVLQGKISFGEEDFVDLIFDDFSDLERHAR